MATKFKALISFSRMKDDELMVTSNTIIGAMTDNTHFPTPSPGLDELQGLLDDFSTKLAVARKRGSPEDTALKNESREPLVDMLRKLGYYVNREADGHLSTLLSSGFPTNSPSGPSLIPLAVEGVQLRDGRQSGQVRLDFVKQRGTLLYEYRYRDITDGESLWSDRFSTSSSRGNIIAPLTVGRNYEVQVRAVNTQGPGDWSNSARILVR